MHLGMDEKRESPLKTASAASISERVFLWVKVQAHQLYQGSIVLRYLGWIRLGNWEPFNDEVRALQRNPLGMFFYNQRAIVFGASGLALIAFSVAAQAPSANWQAQLTATILAIFWSLGVLATLALHKPFKHRLQEWDLSRKSQELPAIFDRYFILDSLLIIALVATGRAFKLPLETFLFLLFANTLVYAAYIRSGYRSTRWVSAALFIIFSLCVTFLVTTLTTLASPHWYFTIVSAAPIVGMILITLFSISMISWLRTNEHNITRKHLDLLGNYEHGLSGPNLGAATGPWEREQDRYNEVAFRDQLSNMLKDLCSQGYPFWYSSACLWFAENHQDRGQVYLPGPSVRFRERAEARDGIDVSTGFLNIGDVVLVHSLKHQVKDTERAIWRFRTEMDAPAALIPLRRENTTLGVLALYGTERGPAVQRQEEAFLRALGSIIANTMEQWEGRFRAFPQKDLDNLFSSGSLEELFPKAAEILQKYLFAGGCMILFRTDPSTPEMEVVATKGFPGIDKNKYKAHVGRGQTGKCASKQIIVRYDHVPKHREDFDNDLLTQLEKGHKRPILSWMAIPIGTIGYKNYGVVKVVNSRFRCSWFTGYDERIATDLALRLRIIIERFLQIKHTEEASLKAQSSAAEAVKAQQKAEETAKQRQQDLMNITHQLQGALISVIGALTGIKKDNLPRSSRTLLDHSQALVEDALALGYGTFTTLAREAGRETAFGQTEINAPIELRKLSRRLQMTNARDDLEFSYNEEPGFPVLKMDRHAFTSVMFSLIHNAMKYADENSEVILECSFERSTGEAALKVKSTGERIDPSEKEVIFEKFRRGKSVERGRHHGGVGLGLWVARELMRALGGDLTVELSPYNPRFAVFIVHVPYTSHMQLAAKN